MYLYVNLQVVELILKLFFFFNSKTNKYTHFKEQSDSKMPEQVYIWWTTMPFLGIDPKDPQEILRNAQDVSRSTVYNGRKCIQAQCTTTGKWTNCGIFIQENTTQLGQ